jgi:hypothetical protein
MALNPLRRTNKIVKFMHISYRSLASASNAILITLVYKILSDTTILRTTTM